MQPDAFADFSPVLENGGVDLLFCGHVHYYNR
jgi:predicted MPP superfamily phosphohydrolase